MPVSKSWGCLSMPMPETVTEYARIETEFWDEELLEKYNVAEAITIYEILEDEEDLRETVDIGVIQVDIVLHHWVGTPEWMIEEAREVFLDEGQTSGIEYLMRSEVERIPSFDVLDYEEWAAWKRNRSPQQLAPISNYGANGTTNLPLFVHAANQLDRSLWERAQRRFGGCAGWRAMRRDLKELAW